MVTRIPARMIETTGVTPGSYSAADITVNSAGQITSASTNSVASSGGGPKITSIVVTDSSYTNTDDTAVGLSGGYIKITGTGFSTGCSIIIGNLVATSVSFISSTEVRAQVPAQSAGTYTVYLVNLDGGVGIRVNGLNYSSTPTWTTTSPLGDGSIDSAISVQLAATSNSAVTYALQAGSTLPAGLSLSSSGLLTGTVTGITVDTTYNFTVVATDQESQDTPQAFSITITVSDPNFKNTVLLLQADTAPTVISDASINNFDLTVVGDTRASNFTPYGTGWSVYFDGSGDYLSIPSNAAFAFGTGDFTIEFWFYPTTGSARNITFPITGAPIIYMNGSRQLQFETYGAPPSVTTTNTLNLNAWNHCAVSRASGTVKVFVNGVTGVTSTAYSATNFVQSSVNIGTDAGTNFATGFMSDVRITKGGALYTADFTPSTTPLTTTVSAGTVSLLTCNSNRFLDGSTNNFTITRNGDAAVRSFNPFNITNTGVNGSAYFDGTGDYITVPDNPNLEPLGGNFTIETWFYLNAVTTGTQICGKSWWTPFYIEGSNLVTYLSSNGSTWDIASNQVIITSVATFRWYHVAMVRNGTSIKVYVNGTETLSLTSSAALHDGSDTLTIGARGTTYLNGYVADLRFVKGTAVYTANFTPPTQPLTAIANTQLLTLQYDQPHNNHTFLDASSNQFAITRNGNTTQGTFSPFSQSGHSVYFDGTGDYLSIPTNTAFDLPGDFTIEFWVYLIPLSGNTNYHIVTRGSYQSGTQDWYIYCNGSYQPAFGYGNPATNINLPSILPNTWNHIAFSRSGTILQGFVNGVKHTSTLTTSNNFTNTRPVSIGTNSNNDPNNLMSGYISNLRITKGAALYTANFTPSTTPLTSVANTSLLACHANRFIDGSANNFTVTRNGDAKITAFGPFSTTAYSATSNGGSAYFDGTGDYLSVMSPIFTLGTSNLTAECWFYPTAAGNSGTILACKISSGAGFYFVWASTSNAFRILVHAGAVWSVDASTSALNLNSWNHLVMTRDGTTIRSFLNGVLATVSTGISGSMGATAPIIKVGADDAGTGVMNACYITDTRIIVGSVFPSYQTSSTTTGTQIFTPPTAPVTATTNTQLLLNFTDAAMRDSRGLAVLETVGDAKTSTVQVKYGTGSMRFDGTGDYLVTSEYLDTNFGSGNFTIECFANFNASVNGTGYILMSKSTFSFASVSAWAFWRTSAAANPPNADSLRFIFSTDGTGSNAVLLDTPTFRPTVGVWYHLAVSRSGSTFRIFIDGISQSLTTTQNGTATTSSAIIDTTRPLYIGASADNQANFNGYIDDLRITRGIARYTANFTPPAAKFLAR